MSRPLLAIGKNAGSYVHHSYTVNDYYKITEQ